MFMSFYQINKFPSSPINSIKKSVERLLLDVSIRFKTILFSTAASMKLILILTKRMACSHMNFFCSLAMLKTHAFVVKKFIGGFKIKTMNGNRLKLNLIRLKRD